MSNQAEENLPNLTRLQENLEKVDGLTKRLVMALANKKPDRPDLSGPDQELYIKAASAYFAKMLSDPTKLIEQQVGHFKRSLEYMAESQAAAADGNDHKKASTPDRRFSGAQWEANPFFNMVRQQYLLSSEAIEEAVSDLDGLDGQERKQIGFFTKQIVDLLSPTNYLGTNPEALDKALKTDGQSLVSGLENMVRDIEANEGELLVTLADPGAFEVGANIASTPGSVVFQNRMFQLIQYAPTTETVHEIPLVIIPPWINKFYILDLKEKNSFIKFAAGQGFTVYVVSWVNPDASLSEAGFDTYMHEGLLEAVSKVREITAQEKVNIIGYCIGGTLLATSLAWLARKKQTPIRAATFFTTLTDFEDAGDLSVFIDDNFLEGIEEEVNETGYLDSRFMAKTFSYLRANDLVYGPAIRSYLMGEAPPAFDLLYWNGDSTNLPARMAKEYLRKLYQNNELARGMFEISGEKLSMKEIRVPVYVVATKTDHIAPWQSSFKGLNRTRGQKRFILAGSGHIAGIINPAGSQKYGYQTNDASPRDTDEWLAGATAHEGSWWADGSGGLARRSGKKIPARKPGKTPNFPAIEPAPGFYVKKKAH